MLAAQVANIGTAVMVSVSIHDFAIKARLRDAEAIAFPYDRSGVHYGDDEVFRLLAAANKGKNAVVCVVGVNPFKSVPIKFDLVKSRFGGVKTIEIAD